MDVDAIMDVDADATMDADAEATMDEEADSMAVEMTILWEAIVAMEEEVT